MHSFGVNENQLEKEVSPTSVRLFNISMHPFPPSASVCPFLCVAGSLIFLENVLN